MAYQGNSYRIPLVRGLTGNTNLTERLAGDLDTAQNVTLFENNIQRDQGQSIVTAAPLSDIIRAGIDYFPTEDAQRTVSYTADGKLQKSSSDGSGAFSDIFTGLDGTNVGFFVEAGSEFGSQNRKLFFFNGKDKPQVLTSDGSATERIGFLASLTSALDTDTGGGSYPSSAVRVNYTNHGLKTGDTISLVGFSNVGSIDPNIETTSVTNINTNSFYFTPSSAPTSTESSGGGTGKVYAHPADWTGTVQPVGGVIHERRLVSYLRHQIYISQILDHTQFEKGDVFDLPIYPDLGNVIVGAVSLFGRLFVLKNPRGIIQIIGPTTNFPEYKVVGSQLGVAGRNAFAEVEGDIIFISQFGSIHSLLAVDSTDEIKSSSISGRYYYDRVIRSEINYGQLHKAVVEYDATNRVVWCAMPSVGSTENDLVFKVDVNEPGVPKITKTTFGTYVSIWRQKDSSSQFRLVAGDTGADIVNLNNDQRSDSTGAAFESKFRTSFTNFSDQYPSLGNVNKSCDYLEFVVGPDDTDIDLTINVYVDGQIRDSKTLSFQTQVPQFPLSFPIQFASDLPRDYSIPLKSCYGRRVSTEFIIDSLNQNFKLSDLVYKFRVGEERVLGG